MIGATYLPGTGDGGPSGHVTRDESDGSAFGVLELVTPGINGQPVPGWLNVNLGSLEPGEQVGYLRELARTADELADTLAHELATA